jgi:hypothetical protein
MGFTPFAAGIAGAGPVALTGAYSAAPALSVTDTTAAPAVPPTQLTGAAASDLALGVQVTGDAAERFTVDTTGRINWGNGAGAADAGLFRNAVARLATNADLDVSVAGKGLRVAEGSNAKQGVATLAAGTVTVANTAVTANSRIFLTTNTVGGTAGFLVVSARIAGTSFTILSSNAADTSVVAWEIFEPG